jgi:lipopolysaccharide export system permease protein
MLRIFNRIIDRYVIRETSTPLIAVCALLVTLFASYSSAHLLTQAADGLLPYHTVAKLIVLKTLIATEDLIPVSLYLAVVIGLGRLYSDNEMTAIFACGIGEGRILGSILRKAIVVAAVVGCLSLFVRPWAYQHSYSLTEKASADFSLDKMVANRFYVGQKGDNVLFAEQIDHMDDYMGNVFFSSRQAKDVTLVIYARHAFELHDDPGEQRTLVFLTGRGYLLDRAGTRDLVIRFKRMSIVLAEREQSAYDRSKMTATDRLMGSSDPKAIAELQWRLFRPLSTVLLGMLGVPLSRARPRQGRFTRAAIAIVVYAVYYNLYVMAESWVRDGTVGAVPGLWWPDGLLAALLLVLFSVPALSRRLAH